MDPVNNLNPVLEALRRQMAENIERLRKSGRLAGTGRPTEGGGTASRAGSLESVLTRRLAAIDRRAPGGNAAATRVFVEVVLAAEFGESLLTDPGFNELLVDVCSSLDGDPETRTRLDQVLDSL